MINNGIRKVWDYGIYNSNNELVMLIDIDGAFYHGDSIDYNDMQSKELRDIIRFRTVPDNVKYHIIYEQMFEKSFESMIEILNMTHQEFLDYQYNLCRMMSFPYPNYTNNEIIKSYDQLCKLKCDDKYHQKLSMNNREGDRIIHHFYQSIYHLNIEDNVSPYDIWYNDDILKEHTKA